MPCEYIIVGILALWFYTSHRAWLKTDVGKDWKRRYEQSQWDEAERRSRLAHFEYEQKKRLNDSADSDE